MGHPDESVNTMQTAMNLPGVKKAGGQTCYTCYCKKKVNLKSVPNIFL